MPEEVLISIAAALAGKGMTSLHELVQRKFGERRSAVAALEAVEGQPADSPEVGSLAAYLTSAAKEDPRFREELIAAFTATRAGQTATSRGVTNQVTGNVTGPVVQARNIHGNVSFGR
ncbi:hypothetical protein [Lentzea sp. NPDC003310]|uniref:hypothetical protein n=1 Tax=Lentzea sp. NPDC003310 TaxID=3154447 RepID=UPI0033A263A8